MRDLRELDKLEQWLDENEYKYGYEHERTDEATTFGGYRTIDRHQITVYREIDGRRFYQWDAICHYGSYGAERGLLEIAGKIVPEEVEDSVEGWLTADDVVERIRRVHNEAVA